MFIFFTHYFYCFLLVFVNLILRFVLFFFSLPKKEPKKASLMIFFCKMN